MTERITSFCFDNWPEILTVDFIQDVLKRIELEANSGDNEEAHAIEDDLYKLCLQSIAEGKCKDAKACAKEALNAHDIKFTRWFS